MSNTTEEVNKVYSKKNPSTYFRDEKLIDSFIENRKQFLLKLKLPPRLFINTTLIDYGCGMGQNTLVFDHLGSSCTLLEFDKYSFDNAKKLFSKHAKNKFKVINTDLFKFSSEKKFDFVVSNGVAHHTKDPLENLNMCCKALKVGGFFILGIGNKAGFFQRNFQRYILYSISENNDDIIKYSKILFKDHLRRAVKFSGRDIYEIIYDTYINPKINTVGTNEILNLFYKHNLSLYSSYYDLKNLGQFLETNANQFQAINSPKNKLKVKDNIFFSDFEDISLSNNNLNNQNLLKQFKLVFPIFNRITNDINDLNYSNFNVNKDNFLNDIKSYKNKILNIKKIDIINKKHNKKFFNEVIEIIRVLNNKKKNKNDKFFLIKKIIDNTENIFKSVNGVGLNYYCGYKNK